MKMLTPLEEKALAVGMNLAKAGQAMVEVQQAREKLAELEEKLAEEYAAAEPLLHDLFREAGLPEQAVMGLTVSLLNPQGSDEEE
jgi:hypothetical protein